MASYLIKKDEKTNEIVYMEYDIDGYEFSPNIKREAYLKINHVTIIKPSMIEKVLAIKFDKSFKKLVALALRILSSEDASEGEAILALDEISRLKSILLHKYNKFLSKEKEDIFNKKLNLLERELRYKQLLINEARLENEYSNEKGFGR